MILDRQLLLSNAQPITATAVSANSIDLASARDIGIGDNLELFIKVIAPLTGGTSVQFAYITSANADLSAANVIVQTPPIPAASLVAGWNGCASRCPRCRTLFRGSAISA